MPELEREDELAARRDEITKQRQKADLAAMVRNQQDAGKKKQSKPASSRKKTRKLKRASAPKKPRKKRSGDDSDEDGGDDYGASEDDDDEDEEEEEEEEESDYERTSTRRGNRARRPTGAASVKQASLHKLKSKRERARKRRQGQETDEESSEDESSGYDEQLQESLWRRQKEREKRERDPVGAKREVKTSREQERIAQKGEYRIPELEDINAARLRRDHFTRLVHRPDWTSQLAGKFARVSLMIPDRNTGRMVPVYRLVQVLDASQRGRYYEVAEQYTNVYISMMYGDEKIKISALSSVSGAPVNEVEYDRWRTRVEQMSPSKLQKHIPSKEATLDMSEDLEAFINRPFTEQDINEMLSIKKQAREAFLDSKNKGQLQEQGGDQADRPGKAVHAEVLMMEMNEKHRKADRERIAVAERRNAAKLKQKAPPITVPSEAKPIGAVAAKAESGAVGQPFSSLSLAAADINVDLGDF